MQSTDPDRCSAQLSWVRGAGGRHDVCCDGRLEGRTAMVALAVATQTITAIYVALHAGPLR